jgi:transforming growth factor-beta-induced protein
MVRTAAVLGFVAPVALTLLLSGCGSSDGGSTTSMPTSDTIADVASGAPELETLVSALTAANLISAVSGSDKLTVFAPTNDAFAELGEATLNCLLAPVGIPTLADVLKYHVVPGEAKSTDLTNKESLKTLDGTETLTVMLADGTVTIEATNNAEVVQADILASNGVVHEVNAVLIPDDFTAPQCGTGSIAATAGANKDLTTLTAALGAANLVDTLDGNTVYTVFAPTDEAFAKLGDATVQCLLKKENVEALTQVLEYHVVAGYDLSSAITDGLKLKTLEAEKLSFSTAGGKVTLTTTSDGSATVTAADVYASNGVVHVIDEVLLPKEFADNNPCSTIVV